MGIVKTPTLITYIAQASANYPQTSAGYTLSDDIDFSLGISVNGTSTLQFSGAKAAIAKLEIFSDPAGASADFTISTQSRAFFRRDIFAPSGSNKTVSCVIPVPHCPKYIKARLTPYDTSTGMKYIYFYAIEQKKT